MPTFELTGPDGKVYDVDGPDAAGAVAALKKMKGEEPSTVADVAKSAGTGLAKGAIGLAGLAGDAQGLVSMGLDKLLGPRTQGAKEFQDSTSLLPTSQGITQKIEGVTGKLYEPKTTAGKYAQSAGEFIPGSMLGPGGTGAKLLMGATAGIGSEAAGQATGDNPYAKLGGAIVGGLTPGALGRLATPAPSSAARQALVQTLNDEGVTSLTAGQRTGNGALRYAESILGDAPGAGQGATRVQQEGQRQFTEAAVRRAGAGPDAAPEVLAENQRRLGDNFRDLSARNNLVPDNQFITDIVDAARNYRRVPDSQQRQMVQGYIDDIVQHVNAGAMPGSQYQEMRSRLSRQAQSLRQSDPTLSETLRDFRGALDHAMDRSISPADRELWNTTRREYGAQKTIENSASRAGEATAEGQITPANLRNNVAANNRGMYARGQGDFAGLARAGSAIMAPLPNSGTGQRAGIQAVVSALGGAAGGAIANVPGAVAGSVAAGAAPAMAGRLLMSRPAQAYLGNQLLSAQLRNLPPARQAAILALMGQDRARLEAPR